MEFYLAPFKKYNVLSGRARRMEYWIFSIVNFIIFQIFHFIRDIEGAEIISVVLGIYFLGVLIPSITVTVRRLHDIGKSGWWYFIYLVPIIGWIWLLVLLASDGVPGLNQYGPNPKEVATFS